MNSPTCWEWICAAVPDDCKQEVPKILTRAASPQALRAPPRLRRRRRRHRRSRSSSRRRRRRTGRGSARLPPPPPPRRPPRRSSSPPSPSPPPSSRRRLRCSRASSKAGAPPPRAPPPPLCRRWSSSSLPRWPLTQPSAPCSRRAALPPSSCRCTASSYRCMRVDGYRRQQCVVISRFNGPLQRRARRSLCRPPRAASPRRSPSAPTRSRTAPRLCWTRLRSSRGRGRARRSERRAPAATHAHLPVYPAPGRNTPPSLDLAVALRGPFRLCCLRSNAVHHATVAVDNQALMSNFRSCAAAV